MYKKLIKRFVDLIASSLLIILLSPLIFFTSLMLFVFNSGRVFFTQKRPGLNEKLFTLYKFKTMSDTKDIKGKLLSDENRLTIIGKWVRKLSLDELPQLINVLKGDMSLIGPRPWLIEYLPLYNNYQKRRHEVRPGITGWAQVKGRNMVSWDQRFQYDIFYVDNVSFLLDLKILALTVWNVSTSHGISAEGMATMNKFEGNG